MRIMNKPVSLEQARRIGQALGVDFTRIPEGEYRRGLEVELEHGANDPQTNVTDSDEKLTGKIAWAHLKEFSDYYTRLDAMEAQARRDWAEKGKPKPGR